jgi:hypothetical protein
LLYVTGLFALTPATVPRRTGTLSYIDFYGSTKLHTRLHFLGTTNPAFNISKEFWLDQGQLSNTFKAKQGQGDAFSNVKY